MQPQQFAVAVVAVIPGCSMLPKKKWNATKARSLAQHECAHPHPRAHYRQPHPLLLNACFRYHPRTSGATKPASGMRTSNFAVCMGKVPPALKTALFQAEHSLSVTKAQEPRKRRRLMDALDNGGKEQA